MQELEPEKKGDLIMETNQESMSPLQAILNDHEKSNIIDVPDNENYLEAFDKLTQLTGVYDGDNRYNELYETVLWMSLIGHDIGFASGMTVGIKLMLELSGKMDDTLIVDGIISYLKSMEKKGTCGFERGEDYNFI